MQKYKMVIAYNGERFHGWQIQPNAPSIQEEIEKALALLTKQPIRITGAGRTDQGVHAIAQVAHFESDIKPALLALNGILPADIRIKELCTIDASFHAQYSATSKIYHYHLWLEKTADPFMRRFRLHLPYALSLELLHEASRLFIGTHDFTTFTNVGGGVQTMVRTIKRIDLVLQEGGARLEFEGDGFLYKMVRNIVGTLLEVASHKRNIADIVTLFSQKDRRCGAICAPAHALFLMQVLYDLLV